MKQANIQCHTSCFSVVFFSSVSKTRMKSRKKGPPVNHKMSYSTLSDTSVKERLVSNSAEGVLRKPVMSSLVFSW